MSLTFTKESASTMDRPHAHVISSNTLPLPFITWPQMSNSDFSMWGYLNKKKCLSGLNLSENRIIHSLVRAKIGWSAVSSGIWPGFKLIIVFGMIFTQWYCMSKLWMCSSIGGNMANTSGSRATDRSFPAWCLALGT